jgi:uncharacterized protein YyaL (SSP411 family)
MDPLAIARTSAMSLANLVQKDGRFKYRYDSQSDTLLDGYNALRHAGAIWAMLEVYRQTADKKLEMASRQSTRYLLDTYLRFFRSHNNACICEDNVIKLGGNALSILALLSLYKTTQDPFLLTLAEQLAQFIVNQRTDDGSLIHKRYFESGKISDFQSMYYTGEALLALLTLHGATHQRHWYEAAWELETKLARQDYGVQEQSHWMLYFLELLSQNEANHLGYHHAEKIALDILENPEYLSWERSTPIACRSEGLHITAK